MRTIAERRTPPAPALRAPELPGPARFGPNAESDWASRRPASELSAGAVSLLNAIATIAPPTTDPWERYPAVLEVDDVAAILGLTPGSAREAARRGNIPMARRLNRYMIDQVVFRRWLAGYDVWAEGLVPSHAARGA